MYKYILFDNDNTLMDFDMSMEFAFKAMYSELDLDNQIPYSNEQLELYEKSNHKWWGIFEEGKCNKTQLQIGRFRDYLNESGITGDAEILNTTYMEKLSQGRFLIDGALEILKKLKPFYKIYITTNGVSTTQHRRINGSEIINYVDGVFVSEDTGFAKPDKKYFEYVMDKLGTTKNSEFLVIGDSLSSDILGANNADMDSIWFNSKGLENKLGINVTLEIKKLKELEKILLANSN